MIFLHDMWHNLIADDPSIRINPFTLIGAVKQIVFRRIEREGRIVKQKRSSDF